MSGFRNYGMPPRNNHQGDERFYNNNRNNNNSNNPHNPSVAAFRRYQQPHHNNQYQQRQQEQQQQFFAHQQQQQFFAHQQQQQFQYLLNRYRQNQRRQQREQQQEEVQRQIKVESAEIDVTNGADLIGTTEAQDYTEEQDIVTNIDRLSQSFTPYVLVEGLSNQARMNVSKARESDMRPFFNLGTLWDNYKEWSIYGVGVPLTLSESQAIVQYYVPTLSGIQLYIEASMTPSDKEGDDSNSPGLLIFEHLEHIKPYDRLPLFDQIVNLSAQCPMLMTLNSCDLMPASWIAVAWYPIYRIPNGTTLKSLDACFLTLHCLSTRPAGNNGPQYSVGNSSASSSSSSATTPLHVFGLASYKLRGSSLLKTDGDHEQQQQNGLMKAADTWLKSLKVNLPDFHFFSSRWR